MGEDEVVTTDGVVTDLTTDSAPTVLEATKPTRRPTTLSNTTIAMITTTNTTTMRTTTITTTTTTGMGMKRKLWCTAAPQRIWSQLWDSVGLATLQTPVEPCMSLDNLNI